MKKAMVVPMDTNLIGFLPQLGERMQKAMMFVDGRLFCKMQDRADFSVKKNGNEFTLIKRSGDCMKFEQIKHTAWYLITEINCKHVGSYTIPIMPEDAFFFELEKY